MFSERLQLDFMYQSNIISNLTVWLLCEPVLFLIPDELDICSVPNEKEIESPPCKPKPKTWLAVQSVNKVLIIIIMELFRHHVTR